MRTIRQLFKNIFKYRLSSVLTLVSLVVAFLGIIVLSLYVSYERSFDGFHKNKNDIYLMSFKYDMGSALPIPMEQLIREKVPEIEKGVVVRDWWDNEFYRTDQTKKDAIRIKAIHASADFFTMFDFPLITGDPKTVLSVPNSVVLSENTAKNIFGTVDVVGRQLLASDNELTVLGVMKDMPKNTSFHCEAIVPLVLQGNQDWSEWSFSIFFQLKKGADKAVVEQKITDIENIAEALKALTVMYSPEAAAVDLMPLSKIHYGSRGYQFVSVNKTVLNVLSILILVLLIMGAVNFINFSASQAPLRAKSLSVQQILGEVKWKARAQIIGEAVILSLIALGLSFIIHSLIFQRLENLFQITGLSFKGRELFYAGFVLFAIIFGAIAAFYPSRYITSPPISQAVKGKMFFSGKGKNFRNMLITVQFVFTIALITASLTIEKQLNFWNNFDIGIDKENVLYLQTSNALRKSHQAFADELMKNADITNYTYTQSLPGQVGMGWGREVDGQQIQLQAWPIDDRFIDFFGIKITEGRAFRQGEADMNNFILNEKAVQQFGWDKPLEKKFGGLAGMGDIVGVAKNFNYASLKGEITPMLFWRTDDRKFNILIKTRGGNFTQIRAYIEETAKRFDPDSTFHARFLDDALEQQYSKETRMARFIEFVSLWTILLALTGLLGLIVFISRDKVKEIGIRKINGASIFEVVRMLNKSVLIWLGIAFVIATPVAYYVMSRWLENFAYKTALSWWIFVLAGLASLIVALLTVSWQSWQAASRNPVEALRYE
ncbi:MAG: ABC transporter permease [Bacteroidales bacterium]|jgi:putative ABC transport system permease protein|nr:ABC transporter permease [Bacteroidales bacterium]MDD2264914.1 ABC transporter permease [Bacteroidales bacterium]MDD2831908.1 ABC transporter permease [Bacteroidales bacterium]MDD3209380.1 ABC transporter permease [Bacteroidales bacterium]MDD3698046.1 ABC transporter permease [Bacteroidales bacterium]